MTLVTSEILVQNADLSDHLPGVLARLCLSGHLDWLQSVMSLLCLVRP